MLPPTLRCKLQTHTTDDEAQLHKPMSSPQAHSQHEKEADGLLTEWFPGHRFSVFMMSSPQAGQPKDGISLLGQPVATLLPGKLASPSVMPLEKTFTNRQNSVETFASRFHESSNNSVAFPTHIGVFARVMHCLLDCAAIYDGNKIFITLQRR